jgi:hypothetical protein
MDGRKYVPRKLLHESHFLWIGSKSLKNSWKLKEAKTVWISNMVLEVIQRNQSSARFFLLFCYVIDLSEHVGYFAFLR